MIYNLSEKYNIKLWSYHLPIIPFYELELSNPHMCDGAIKHFCTLMEKVADIGVKTFVVHPSVEPINDSDRPDRIECSKHSIARLSQFAKKFGAVVAVEDLPRSCLGNCSGEIKELISLDDSLGVCFDTKHLPKEDPVDFIHAIGDKIITTHISDYDFSNEKHWMPGEGKNNWDKIYKALNEVGFKGPWLYEVGFLCPDTITRSHDLCCADFANMQEIGIDTVIFIRGGLEDRSVFPSKVLGTPYADDFASFVFEETSKRNMDVFFGMYISNLDWNGGDAKGEIRKNILFTDEVYKRYGDYPSFKGWYIPQEQSHNCLNFGGIMRGMSAICKDKTPDKSVFTSPFFHTHITADKDWFTPRQHRGEWEKLFSCGGGDIDICAFQDGTAPMDKIDEFYTITRDLCEKYNIRHWVNAETFEHDVRCMYYPITLQLLRRRLEHHKNYAEKSLPLNFRIFSVLSLSTLRHKTLIDCIRIII